MVNQNLPLLTPAAFSLIQPALLLQHGVDGVEALVACVESQPTRRPGPTTTVRVTGCLDRSALDELRRRCLTEVDVGSTIVIEFVGLTDCSSGLFALLSHINALAGRCSGRLRLVGLVEAAVSVATVRG